MVIKPNCIDTPNRNTLIEMEKERETKERGFRVC